MRHMSQYGTQAAIGQGQRGGCGHENAAISAHLLLFSNALDSMGAEDDHRNRCRRW
jgi:hypothetical protein